MTALRYDRPSATEFAAYYGRYIGTVPDGDLLRMLEEQGEQTTALLSGVPESRGGFAYGAGKWTLKEVLGHIADAERVFAYRALRIARGDQTPLPGFDQEPWVPQSGANARTLADLLGELRVVRAATLALLRHLPPEAVGRMGTASDQPVSVRALAWIIAGHERHHLAIVRERYLS
ncbi:MAG TPA: DinB family protein [Gemmatimonadales bacterium]|nr:DinB family protein [Gemmatimonadales bacterium]